MLTLVLIILAIWVFSSMSKKSSGKNTKPPIDNQSYVNQQWMDFIGSYYQKAKTGAQKKVIAEMIQELLRQGMPSPSSDIVNDLELPTPASTPASEQKLAEQSSAMPALAGSASVASDKTSLAQPSDTKKVPTDNTTTLLYFGAFLFLTAAGLFVALAGSSGVFRLGVILLVIACMYSLGVWLFRSRPKLKTAGLTFAGIGMMLAPLAGLAAYTYLLDRNHAGPVWLVTSLFCLGIYYHALKTFRHPLLDYVLIGTIVSAFESSVSVLSAPVYYYGWMLAAVGLILSIYSIKKNRNLTMEAPEAASANVLIPVSILTALCLFPQFGSAQLAVSVLIGSIYYGLQAWYASTQNLKITYVTASQTLALFGAGLLAYSFQESLIHVGVILLILWLPQLWLIFSGKFAKDINDVVSDVTLVSLIISVGFCWMSAGHAVLAIAVVAIYSLIMWLKFNRTEIYMVFCLAVLALPAVIGVRVADTIWPLSVFALVYSGLAILQLMALPLLRNKINQDSKWLDNWRILLVGQFILAAILMSIMGSWHGLVAGVLASIGFYCANLIDKWEQNWLNLSAVAIAVPVLLIIDNKTVFLAAVLATFAWELFLTLNHRVQLSRWLGSVAWAILPIAFAEKFSSLDNSTWYSLSYLFATTGFVVARALAMQRTAKLPLSLTELEKRLTGDSQIYVAGYVISSILALSAAFSAGRWLATVVAACLCLIYFAVSRFVEKNPKIIYAVALLVQITLWASFRSSSYSVVAYQFLSSILAILGLVLGVHLLGDDKTVRNKDFQTAFVASAYVSPLSAIWVGNVWTAPLGLLLASLATYYLVRNDAQQNREASIFVGLISVFWFMYYLGVRNPQAYSHVLAATFAAFAYWRNIRGEKQHSNSYVIAALTSVTLPLAWQLISGMVGGLYGWWLLTEQIAIMLIGMNIKNRLMIRWGLYVAVASVLYQVRYLAWLALTILALFLISLAVYRLQKSDSSKD